MIDEQYTGGAYTRHHDAQGGFHKKKRLDCVAIGHCLVVLARCDHNVPNGQCDAPCDADGTGDDVETI